MKGLTLDIGGTKVRGNFYDGTSVERFEIRGWYGRPEDATTPFEDLSEALSSILERREVERVAVNLGGKNTGQIKATVLKAFPNARVSVSRESEGTLARAILATYEAQVLVMAGTGCIAFSRFGKSERVLGGWGYDLGDEGSGYHIGRLAVGYALRELEDGKPLSLFTQELFKTERPFAFERFEQFLPARDSARGTLRRDRHGIAALARLVASCAERGCALSKRVLKENAEEIASLVLRALDGREGKVVINGGVAACAELWKEDFFKATGLSEQSVLFTADAIDQALKTILEEEI